MVQQCEQWTENTALGGASAQCDGAKNVLTNLDSLRSLCKEVRIQLRRMVTEPGDTTQHTTYAGFPNSYSKPYGSTLETSNVDISADINKIVTGLSSLLQPPKNSRLISHNMGAILIGLGDYETVCVSAAQQCDFGTLPSCNGHFEFRVRAKLGGETSKWSKREFSPDEDTVIGPPTVALVSQRNAIEVTITDPTLKVSSLRRCFSKVTYVLKYWKSGDPNQMSKSVTEQQIRLRNLENETKYCVEVWVHIPAYKRDSQHSDSVCETTSTQVKVKGEKKGSSQTLVVSLVVVAVAVPLLLLTAWFVHQGKRLYNPKVSLPPRFKQHLLEGPGVSVILALSSQEQYDKISSFYTACPHQDILPQNQECPHFENMESKEEVPQYRNIWVSSEVPYENI
ncbi:interleukin-10 receptor subunit beta-like [Lampris incognitus]|uniref:interleukin-10 receptor subunit beta-like n=1 Tax=Lampris incognitus TaxID=2546036 RepID=UPI0024B4DAEA|nr:interleukin-10 receptor subunit beta-like [Lampris incognitus]